MWFRRLDELFARTATLSEAILDHIGYPTVEPDEDGFFEWDPHDGPAR